MTGAEHVNAAKKPDVFTGFKSTFYGDGGFREYLRNDCFSLRAYYIKVGGGMRAKCVLSSLC